MSNSYELSHLMSAVLGLVIDVLGRKLGHHCLAYSQLSRTSITE